MMRVQVIATIWIYVMEAASSSKARRERKAGRYGRHRTFPTTETPQDDGRRLAGFATGDQLNTTILSDP